MGGRLREIYHGDPNCCCLVEETKPALLDINSASFMLGAQSCCRDPTLLSSPGPAHAEYNPAGEEAGDAISGRHQSSSPCLGNVRFSPPGSKEGGREGESRERVLHFSKQERPAPSPPRAQREVFMSPCYFVLPLSAQQLQLLNIHERR